MATRQQAKEYYAKRMKPITFTPIISKNFAQLVGLPQLEKKLNSELSRYLRSATMKLYWESTQEDNHYYKSDTGNFTKNIKWKFEETENGKVGKVYINTPEVPYAKFQIGGTGLYGPHKKMINLNSRGLFRGYYWRRQDRWSFNPKVKGIKKDDFMGRVYRQNIKEINRKFRLKIEAIVKKAKEWGK